jgi:dienelactone hydrolase
MKVVRGEAMRTQYLKSRYQAALLVALLAVMGSTRASAADNQEPRQFTEQLVYVQSQDEIVDAGALFLPPKDVAKPIAVIWIHGWGVNFYFPAYVQIGRALAQRGYATILANTRMHDIGNVETWQGDKKIRGGGYWGVPSERVRDLAAWIDFAEKQGFKKVVLVGHSDGWAAVRDYAVQKQDERVSGLVLASGGVAADTRQPDPDLLAQATRMMAEGQPDDLVRLPGRSFPSFVSAATLLDLTNTPPELKDFFGIQTPKPGVTRIHCPLLAFFGTSEDVGNEEDLALLKSSIQRQASGPSRVNTVMIRGADHMYTGQEQQVAETIAAWADSLAPAKMGKVEGQKGR